MQRGQRGGQRGSQPTRGLGPLGLLAVLTLALTPTLVHCGTPPCADGEVCVEGEGDGGGATTGDAGASDASVSPDASRSDAASSDAGDGGDPRDAAHDAQAEGGDGGGIGEGGTGDAGGGGDAASDAGGDAASDAGGDAASDAGGDAANDGGDAGSDAGAGPGGCVSGAIGDYAARFKWLGSGPSSRAYVSYELNNLPDSARWRAGAYSRAGVGYVPSFTDTFLGVGGLELGSTTFIDVELSTAMLASVRRVTLSIFGRSFNTTAPGSFSWMTFDGAGAAPAGLVSNSAPYRWYSADATAAFRPGNAGVLLRISPGGPSGTLIVSRVELCFEARR